MKKYLSIVLFLAFFWVHSAEAAISNGTVFEVESGSTAANVNGAGFNPGNANFPTDGAATLATGNAAVFTSASYNFVAGDTNAWLFIKSGSNWNSTCYYKITSVAANAATLNSTLGSGVCVSNTTYAATTVAGVATVASPIGATWGIDYSQQTAAAYTATTASGATTAFTDATNVPAVNWIGNLIHLTAGTGETVGWYECTNISGSNCTLDRTAGTSYSSVTYHMGGAAPLGSSTTNQTDSNFFSIVGGASNGVTGGRYFIKNASYTMGNAVTAGTSTYIEGYNSLRGDTPTGTSRPTFVLAANGFTLSGGSGMLKNMIVTASGAAAITGAQSSGSNTAVINCKVINASSLTALNNISTVMGSEVVSYSGTAVVFPNSAGGQTGFALGNYIHDSNIGVSSGGVGVFIAGNILAGNITSNVNVTGGSVPYQVNGNVIYGAENKLGIGITDNGNVGYGNVFNNIMYGLTTGVSGTSAMTASVIDNYNDYYNNTTDVSNAPKGTNTLAVNPAFTSVSQVTGTTATTTAGNHLVQSGATFIASGVTAGRDYLYVTSGTGVTTGIYGILSVDSATQITTDNTLTANATADKHFQITVGRNWTPGVALSNTGYPGLFSGGATQSYTYIGAVQPQASSAATTGYAWSQ